MEVGQVIQYVKGKAPKSTGKTGKLIIYLSPEYLRNNAPPIWVNDFLEKVPISKNDILLLWDGSNAGEFFLGKEGALSSTMVKLVFDETDFNKQFLYYQLKGFEEFLKSQTSGSGIPHVDKATFRSLEIENFSPEEQQKIASILSQADEAIQQTEALIAKYSRIKTGLMQDLLTKGIDDAGNIRSEEAHAFQDSPLGRIPVEWEVDKLEELKTYVTSGSRGWAKFYAEEGSKFIRITNLKRGQIEIDELDMKFVNLPDFEEGTRSNLQEGDILISITADLGIIGVVPKDFGEAYVNQHISLVRLDTSKANPIFIGYFLSSEFGVSMFNFLNDGGAKAGLNLQNINNLDIVLPPPLEQNRIIQLIRIQESVLHQLKSQSEKLKSLKTGLMQDLLSGKVRVNHLIPESTDP